MENASKAKNAVKKIINMIKRFFSCGKTANNEPLPTLLLEQPEVEAASEPIILEPPKPKRKFILSFDGGGNKTLVEVIVLSRIEKILKEFDPNASLQSAFDLFAGTSAGGLNAMMLAGVNGCAWTDLKKISILKASTIFTPNKKLFYRVMSSKYANSGITKVLEETFGAMTLDQTAHPFLVMAFDTISLKPVMISNMNDFKYLSFVQAGLATTAAPVYFSPQKITHNDTEYNLVDGGIVANNPSMYAYKLARSIFPDADEYHVLSLGSYKNPEHFDNTDGSFSWIDVTKGYGLPIQKVYHVAGEETASEIMSAIKDVEYLRIENGHGQFKDNFKVDSTSEHDTIRLMEIGEKIADEYESRIREFLKTRFS